MERALSEFRIRGVKNNIPFLQNVISHPEFRAGLQGGSFIEKHPELLQLKLSRNRGTRILNFTADLIVNGNPEVKNPDPNRRFRNAKVPDFDKHAAHTPGTKNLLTELGPEKFSQWLAKEKKIYYTDTTFKDAHQSLLATRMRTIDMLKVAESYSYKRSEA